MLGACLGAPAIFYGVSFLAENAFSSALFVGTILFLAVVFSITIFLLRDRILQGIWGTAKTELTDVIEPFGQAIQSSIELDKSRAVESGAEFVKRLAARYSWLTAVSWMLTILFALIASFAAFTTAALMYRQNILLDTQNTLFKSQNELIIKQNSAIDRQTKIVKTEVMPQLVIDAAQLKLNGEERASTDRITVVNRGAVITEVHSSFCVFFRLSLVPKSPTHPRFGNKIEKVVPVNGYYDGTAVSPNGIGQLLQIDGIRNNIRRSDLARAFVQLAKEKGYYGELRVQRFLRLAYRDQLGERHEEYFYIDVIQGSERLLVEDGKRKFAEWMQGFQMLQQKANLIQ